MMSFILRSRFHFPKLECFTRHSVKFYHSKTGVYGYMPEKDPSMYRTTEEITENRIKHSNLFRFINAYREHGHKVACLDPLNLLKQRSMVNLNPDNFGLKNQTFDLKGLMFVNKEEATLEEIINDLENVYCKSASFECSYVMHDEEREWLNEKIETVMSNKVSNQDRVLLAQDMLKSQALDQFIATKLPSVKRYGCEGSESMFGFFNTVFRKAAEDSIEDIEIGIPHRGRTNLLIGKLNVPPVTLLRMMKGLPGELGQEDEYRCVGDVLSHAIASTELKFSDKEVHVSLLRNPSHLEIVNPVVMGKTRGRQQFLNDGDYSSNSDAKLGDKVLCLQIHGDAAFAGQGVVMETLAMSAVPHFNVGGSIHLIINNQLGFTAPSDRSRSSMYCSDVMKMIAAPVIHVNGDDPDAVIKTSEIAFEYRQKFRKDVLIDLVTYRQWGHNELDDPTFTNPEMYQAIAVKPSVPNTYSSQLIEEDLMSKEEVDKLLIDQSTHLLEHLKMVDSVNPTSNYLNKQWSGYKRVPQSLTKWKTGLDIDLLKFLGSKSVQVPDDFALHPHLKKTFVDARLKKLIEGDKIDWATAESLAISSLLYQGYNVRLCGQDVGRGTFSQRHAMLVDQESNEMYIPLNDISSNQKGFFEVINSILSEEAVLGFEYGMSIESPNRLNIWEAQFGDFYNGAQIVIDTYISSGDVKWLQQSGLVMLLPHGFDGAGPDHSSSHVERFLQLCDSKENCVDSDNVNMEIAIPTTPAQYFHLLRRQMIRNYRVPLIIVSPKILLRLPAAVSSLNDMNPISQYATVIGDQSVNPQNVKKVVFCAGQHYYNLVKHRSSINSADTAIIRLESLCPFPVKELQAELSKYDKATQFIWSQEEHRNMGCYSFVNPRFRNLVGCELTYAGKRTLGVTAEGHRIMHEKSVNAVFDDTFRI